MFGSVNASGNSVATSPQTAQPSAATMKERLDAWVKSAPNGTGECREIAAQRINSAYEYHTADLDLSNLELTSLPEGVFADLINLQSLDLSGNRLRSLPDKDFEGLSNLQYLRITNNQFTGSDQHESKNPVAEKNRELYKSNTKFFKIDEQMMALHFANHIVCDKAPFIEGDLVFGLARCRFALLMYFNKNDWLRLGDLNMINSYPVLDSEIKGAMNSDRASKKPKDTQRIFYFQKFVAEHTKRYVALGWNENNQSVNKNAALRSKSKAGLEYMCFEQQSNIIHFCLDDLDFKEVASKAYKSDYKKSETDKFRIITNSELRWIYRNWDKENVQRSIQFWRRTNSDGSNFETCDAPWVSSPQNWKSYVPHSKAK